MAKVIHLTMVTTEGIEHNEGWQSIQSEKSTSRVPVSHKSTFR